MPELTDEDRAARRHGLGGSDMAGIFQLGYRTPFGVWADKVWGHEEPDSGAFQRGHDLEPIVARKIAERTGRNHLEPGRMTTHDDHPWMFATFDYRDRERFAKPPVECKTSDQWVADRWGPDDTGPDGVPDNYVIQVTQQIAVAGSDHAVIGVLFVHSWELRTYVIPRDDRIIGLMVDGGEHFWREHVQAKVPPPVTDAAKDWDALKSIPVDVERQVDLPPAAADLVVEWRRARTDRKAAEKVEKECKTELARLMGGAGDGMIGGGLAVTLRHYDGGSSTRQVIKDAKDWTP